MVYKPALYSESFRIHGSHSQTRGDAPITKESISKQRPDPDKPLGGDRSLPRQQQGPSLELGINGSLPSAEEEHVEKRPAFGLSQEKYASSSRMFLLPVEFGRQLEL
jgi:hypothetical protein